MWGSQAVVEAVRGRMLAPASHTRSLSFPERAGSCMSINAPILERPDARIGARLPKRVGRESVSVHPSTPPPRPRTPVEHELRLSADQEDREDRPSPSTGTAPQLEEYWEQARAHVRSVLDLPVAHENSELRDRATRYLAAVTSAVERMREDETGRPPVVQRSIAFIHANLQRPVRAADIAQASGASLRAVQTAFKISMGTTPLQYLLDARVAAARAQLLADPSTTVTALARHWGFSNAGRFSSRYREIYGEHPSRTQSQLRTASPPIA